jgi:DHA1 family tetracycline resistance protein-like MFS transporter
VSQLVGPFLFTLTFSYFIGASAPWHLPGAPFLLAAVLMVLCVMIAMRAVGTAKTVS